MKNRQKYSLEEIDFCRKLGIIWFADETSEEDDCHIEVSTIHNFMCDYCEHFLNHEEGFVLVPLSRIKELKAKIGDKI